MKKLISLALTTILLAGCVNSIPQKPNETTKIFKFSEKSFDFGKIKQSGGKVKHQFEFKYNGEQKIKITGVPTSCACTSASVNKTELAKGETGILTVKFNPNLHAEPDGIFFKTVSILTEPPLTEIPEVKIWTEIDLDLGAEAFELKSDHDDEEKEEDGRTAYTSITAEKFAEMQKNKDFFLVDVHIPEQSHIANTDAILAYDRITENLDKLPTDKNTKIVLYCRSGSMSRAAAYQLAEKGFTNIFDIVGGKIAYDDFLETEK